MAAMRVAMKINKNRTKNHILYDAIYKECPE